jgi:hypothetical protein
VEGEEEEREEEEEEEEKAEEEDEEDEDAFSISLSRSSRKFWYQFLLIITVELTASGDVIKKAQLSKLPIDLAATSIASTVRNSTSARFPLIAPFLEEWRGS